MTHDTSPSAAGRFSRRQLLLAGLAIGLACLIGGLVYLVSRLLDPSDDRSTDAAAQVALEEPEVLHYSLKDLSTLSGYLSDLDEGRLRAAPPIGWSVAPRSRDCVVRFLFDRTQQSPLPRITIESHDADFSRPRDVTRANLPEFFQRIMSSLKERHPQALEGDTWALVLGDIPCVAYQMRKRKFSVGNRKYTADREVLVTLRNGRLYEVTLDVYTGKLDDYRADAWAVVAGLQFPQPPASNEQETPAAEDAKGTSPEQGAGAAGKADAAPPNGR